ncbi:hypothetical protein ERICIV_04597 (plasmid) [Paenibacillus larvae subsp. larvae]|uniref:Mobilization protein n=1 Tax=Paenibacillus larvae subsp. larvae TaxID=147375 RepID=A0A2L1UK91_9BACL|nr:hypothetical protein [Paenibacillus larvae]AQZ49323.1 hypothetical protein B5S25_22750 [Paenibacillus larvae subsp. pulvifaciens]AVF28979.1 hypothetical protein ERICIII_04978 [Paenibacillus larvae subsp. larvae]AVF33360.1 hypothetical protein ERICIV_04597 [Paenibacillus larvae subsp. larvae]MCY7518887.1 hypothetical protein [Paenibacillus larvae]MCY9502652.1 hypothetical protein [Paenibacillus larvae]
MARRSEDKIISELNEKVKKLQYRKLQLKKGHSKVTGKEPTIGEVELKLSQLQAQKERLEQRLSNKERKLRTRRLIQIGAILEKNFGLKSIEETETVATAFRDQVQRFLEIHRENELEKQIHSAKINTNDNY